VRVGKGEVRGRGKLLDELFQPLRPFCHRSQPPKPRALASKTVAAKTFRRAKKGVGAGLYCVTLTPGRGCRQMTQTSP
jgi:hypothetical protein